MKEVHLLTGNLDKIASANIIFKPKNIVIRPLKLDIEEIQAANSIEIARYMALEAHKISGVSVIREDHSFYIDDLGIPGPYMAYMDKVVSPEQLLRIVQTLENKTGHFEIAAAYVDEKGNLFEFSYEVPVEFSEVIRGDENQNWERLIKLPGESRVFAEYDSSYRSDLWTKNYEEIAKIIDQN
jgi:non-canonical purine NTP pyrophosphatase (RdgB/HAM1 family)